MDEKIGFQKVNIASFGRLCKQKTFPSFIFPPKIVVTVHKFLLHNQRKRGGEEKVPRTPFNEKSASLSNGLWRRQQQHRELEKGEEKYIVWKAFDNSSSPFLLSLLMQYFFGVREQSREHPSSRIPRGEKSKQEEKMREGKNMAAMKIYRSICFFASLFSTNTEYLLFGCCC